MKKNTFTFFHGYDKLLWQGYEKCGLINGFAGVRFCQNLLLPETSKFNILAARGDRLFSLISNNHLPWYIDRLQGGCYIEQYPYELRLVDEIGGEFFGFQMHEWISNMRSDYSKLNKLPENEWNEEAITREIFSRFPFENVFLEAASAREYAERFPVPKKYADLLVNAENLFALRQNYTSGRLLPCDSVMMAPNLEFKLGAQRVMPEIGAQTPGANIQVAYARGMAKAYGKSFGTYYEPWGGKPFAACSYHSGGKNEWNIIGGDFAFETAGCNGGSSRSLQKRLYLYSYLAGANFISEEWGAYNTFLDTEDFTLSPYGEVKRDFLSFAERYPAGEFFAPIAIVLPKSMYVLSSCNAERWFGALPYEDEALGIRERQIEKTLESLMLGSFSQYGNETNILPNNLMPDAFDVIHEDCESAFCNYEYLVDLTGNHKFSKNHTNAITADMARELVLSLMPCTVSGGVHWFVNKTDDGWYLTVFNNDGIDRSVENGEQKIAEATRTAIIDIKTSSSLTRLEGCRDITKVDGKYYVTMTAGEVFFAKMV